MFRMSINLAVNVRKWFFRASIFNSQFGDDKDIFKRPGCALACSVKLGSLENVRNLTPIKTSHD